VGSDPIHSQYHVDAMGRQHSKIPIERVTLDDHFHSFAQQGASDIPERRARDNGHRSGGCMEGEFIYEPRGDIGPGCTGVEENQSRSTTNQKLTDHDVGGIGSLLLSEVVQPSTAGGRGGAS
jgi:hypothetical protein